MTGNIVKCLAVLLALAALPASAIYPETGWYWNPNESGRGFNLEIQDNVLFMSAFVYRADGTPAWYVAGGPMTDDKNFTADLFETSGGQCLGCAYRPNTATKVGTATVVFSSERAATITLPGATISVIRQDWSGYGSASRDALVGEWSSTEGDPVSPLYSGDRISLYIPQTDAAGPYISGSRTGAVINQAVGEFNLSIGTFSIVLDSSAGFFKLYVFSLNAFNRAEGAVWTYAKTSQPTGPGTYYVAHRTKSGAFLRTGVGPAVFKRAEYSSAQETVDALAARSVEGEAPAGVVETAKRLQALLGKR
jgi:hypothetical protein